MGTIPDAHATNAALCALTEQMRHLLHTSPAGTDSAALLRLAGELVRLTDQALWCRDAALALARQPECQVSWTQLEHETGIPDATLIGRLQRWRCREVKRAVDLAGGYRGYRASS